MLHTPHITPQAPHAAIHPIWPGWVLGLFLTAVAAGAVSAPALLVGTASPVARVQAKINHPRRVIPKDVVPPVEPVKYEKVSLRDAVAYNDSIPFSSDPNPAASPFRFGGDALDHERAVTCLAAAVLYEAGDDPVGQAAVAQVVLNHVRHPAFPSSVCGVVFQGSERRTGCQFTFTCDGALRRHYPQVMWDRARKVATAAIDGAVDKTVGHATHYHTNWVVPYWSSSLDKIAEVNTHLFFRWTGWWGTPAAFSRKPSGAEPVIGQLAAYSPAHADSEQAALDALGTLSADAIPAAALPKPIAVDADTYVTALDPRMAPSEYRTLAERVCGERAYCKFLAWDQAAQVPQVSLTNLPADSPALQTMAFSYLRDRGRRFEKALWNCTLHPRDAKDECMRQRMITPTLVAAAATTPLLPKTGSAADSAAPKPDSAAKADGAAHTAKPVPFVPKPIPSPSLTPMPGISPGSGR